MNWKRVLDWLILVALIVVSATVLLLLFTGIGCGASGSG